MNTPPEGQPQSNVEIETRDVTISDLRGIESRFSLSQSAFATLSHVPSAETEFGSDEHIRSTYYPEVEDLIRKHVDGAKRVVLFDHTVRRQAPGADRAPVTRVHIDQTAASTVARVRLHMGDDADELLRGRYRIINVWRPINGDVESFPLAIADRRTVHAQDLVGIEHRYPDRTGETAGVKYTAEMKWYYWSGMGNDERLLLQCFDSDDETSRVPHTAFADPRSGGAAKPRESIEVRALVFG